MNYRPCPCRSWGKCQGFDDYHLWHIIPCKAQVVWLLAGECEFVRNEAPGSRRVLPHASFVPLADLRAEVDYRLDRTGRDGETLVHEVRVLGVRRFPALSQAARDAVNYIAGRKRKRMSYRRWIDQRERRKNEATGLQETTVRA